MLSGVGGFHRFIGGCHVLELEWMLDHLQGKAKERTRKEVQKNKKAEIVHVNQHNQCQAEEIWYHELSHEISQQIFTT